MQQRGVWTAGFFLLGLVASSEAQEASPKFGIRVENSQRSREQSIDPEGPTMPQKRIIVTPDQPVQIHRTQYDINLIYTANGRNDATNFAATKEGSNILIDWGAFILGGTLQGRGRVYYTYLGVSRWSDWIGLGGNLTVTGINPTLTQMRAHGIDLPALAVSYHKSKHRMFDESGQPHFGSGFGLFQLVAPTKEEVWNWKKNSDAGVADFEVRRNQAQGYPEELRRSDPRRYQRLPDYTKDQLKMETYQSYSDDRYWVPRKGWFRWKWVKNPQVNDFADTCLTIEKRISRPGEYRLSGKEP